MKTRVALCFSQSCSRVSGNTQVHKKVAWHEKFQCASLLIPRVRAIFREAIQRFFSGQIFKFPTLPDDKPFVKNLLP